MPRRNHPARRRWPKRAYVPGSGGGLAERIANELRAERLGIWPSKPDRRDFTPMVSIGSLTERSGIAYVRLTEFESSAVVTWNRRSWRCRACGEFTTPTCPHARIIPRSPEIKRAREARGLANERNTP